MKTKIKRQSRSVISVLLAVCMLISCMTAAMIATDAAKVNEEAVGAKADSETVGDTTYYLRYSTTNNKRPSMMTNYGAMTKSGDVYTASFSVTAGTNFWFLINDENTLSKSLLASTSVSKAGTINNTLHESHNEDYNGSSVTYSVIGGSSSASTTVTVTYNPTADSVALSTEGASPTEPTTEETTSASGETWIVAGSNIFGTTWSTGDTNNTMTYDGSMYYLEKTGVTSISTFEFRITKNNGWTGAVPSGNFVVNHGDSTKPRTVSVSNSDLYWDSGDTIIITFDGSSNISVSSEPTQDKHNVTVTAGAGGSVSPSGTVRVGEVTSKTLTATPTDAYTVGSWEYGDGINLTDNNNGTASITTKSSGSYTVKANFTKKPVYKVTARSNNSDYGTATASVGAAYAGQSVTVTYAENTGTYSSYTVVGSDGVAVDGASIEGNTISFTMPAKPVTVTVNFDEYTGTSNYYYNGYNKDSFAQISGKYAQQMSKGKINGVEYSYYHVQGRTEVDQTFTVSYGDLDYNRSTTKYMYWTRPSSDSYHSPAWSNNGNQYALFYSNDGQIIQQWTNMEGVGSTNGGYKFKTKIPDGARYARVKDQYNSNQTVLIDLNTHTNGDHNGFYISGHDGTNYTVTGWKENNDTIGDVFEYFYGSNNYTNDYDTNGFFEHKIYVNVEGANRTHSVAKPKGLTEAYRNDYYILVFHPNTAYNYNGVEDTTSTDPIILWSPTKPGETNNNATVYAKDGTLRNNSTNNNITSVYETYALHATTLISVDGTNAGDRHDDKYTVYTQEKDNTQITVTTTIDSGDWRSNYYVKGFSVNGVTPALYEYNTDGTYSVTLTLGEDKILYDGGEIDYVNEKYVEITPIYYAKTPGDTVTFYVRGFDEEVAASWGNTVAAYPFYNSTYAGENALGGYPGQPMINYGGKLYIDVPLSVTYTRSGTSYTQSIQGITLNNYYWDRIHGTTDNEGNFQHIRAVDTHAQTYDFDDFSKIYYENEGDEPDFIYFEFKYETAKNNEYAASKSADTSYNTFEDLLDAQGQKTDIFGNILEGADLEESPIYVVSDGYFNTFAGAYATQWHVYQNDGTFIGTVAPSVRWIKAVANLNTTKYPYTSTKYSTGQYYPITDFTEEYTALQSYVNTPVKISYDREIRNETGQTGWDSPSNTKHNSNDDDKAKRSDGVWMYSYNGVKINAYTKVEISTDDGETFVEDPYTDGNKTVNELAAYFTNEDFYGETDVETRSSSSDEFTFNAESAGEFMFVGWYLLDNGKYYPVSKNTSASSSMDAGATFVARFIENPSGTLNLSHTVLKDATYNGDADTYIGVEVVDTSNLNKVIYSVTDRDKKSEVTLNNTYVKYNHGYTVNVTIYTTPKLDDTFARYQTGPMDAAIFFDYSTTAQTPTRISSFSFDIDDLFTYDDETTHYTQTTNNLRYYSQLNQIRYSYKMTYHYTSYREKKGVQTYYVENIFTEDDIKNYLVKSNEVKNADDYNYNTTAYDFKDQAARKAFIDKYGPYENNFLINLSWNAELGNNGTTIVYHGNTRSYVIDVQASTTLNDIVDLQIKLPYNHGSVDQKYDAIADSTTGNINYNNNYPAIDINNLTQMTWYSTNGKKNYNDPNNPPTFVTAPKVIYSGTIPLYFRYWSVKTQPSDTNSNKVEYTRCYYQEFNLAIYQDSYVEPVYTELTEDEKSAGYIPNPHAEAMKNNTGATITFMENSRNQYNDGGSGSETIISRQQQGDRIFTDFLISFASEGDVKYNQYAANTYTAGIAIERVAKLPKNKTGDYYTQKEEVYQDTYGMTLSNIDPIDGDTYTTKEEEVKAFIESAATYTTDSNAENSVVFQKSEFDAKGLDNKNRLDYYYSMSVRNHSGEFVNNHNSEYVYRAYSYIKDKDGNVVMLSETPLYFTIYDMASIANAADGT